MSAPDIEARLRPEGSASVLRHVDAIMSSVFDEDLTNDDEDLTFGLELNARHVRACLKWAELSFPDTTFQPVARQGRCSYTIQTKSTGRETVSRIIQFRQRRYAVDIAMASKAHRMYSPLAPETRLLGDVLVGKGLRIQALGMNCVDGERYSDLQPQFANLDSKTLEKQKALLRSISTFFAKQWYAGQWHQPALSGCPGRVGRSLLFRLESLERHLPTEPLRRRAQRTRERVEAGELDLLPVVLTHGDLLPSNIMVEPQTWCAKGYVDWAEAEWLPYGLCQYGIEHLSGYLRKDGGMEGSVFVRYRQAEELRGAFWKELEQRVPEFRKPEVRRAVQLGGDIGTLLWYDRY
jgi:hypothetical protein